MFFSEFSLSSLEISPIFSLKIRIVFLQENPSEVPQTFSPDRYALKKTKQNKNLRDTSRNSSKYFSRNFPKDYHRNSSAENLPAILRENQNFSINSFIDFLEYFTPRINQEIFHKISLKIFKFKSKIVSKIPLNNLTSFFFNYARNYLRCWSKNFFQMSSRIILWRTWIV